MGKDNHWWTNLGPAGIDGEIRRIDAMADDLGDLPQEAIHIRRLINMLEICHHKALRRIELIVQAIGQGRTEKGPGEGSGRLRSAQIQWKRNADILESWADRVPSERLASQLRDIEEDVLDFYDRLGLHTPLKVWQVRRLVERIRTHVDLDAAYDPIEEDECEFARKTCNTLLVTAEPPGAHVHFTLAEAINHCVPCNWHFDNNLRLVLSTIGGKGDDSYIFAAHACNLRFSPLRDEMREIACVLDAFAYGKPIHGDASWVVGALGPDSAVKRWLAACLSKTIRSQMDLD